MSEERSVEERQFWLLGFDREILIFVIVTGSSIFHGCFFYSYYFLIAIVHACLSFPFVSSRFTAGSLRKS